MGQSDVLLLNCNYEPLHVCSLMRAVALLMKGKVEVLHLNGHTVRTTGTEFRAPSVIRLRYQIKRPLPVLRMSRHAILARDNYLCQYCGSQRDLTIDHVVPRWVGGKHTWDNVVTCCRRCNLKKGEKTPAQARMTLAKPPRRPSYVPYISLPNYVKAQDRDDWLQYLPVFEGLRKPS
ncbi:MAG: HNH endonuclease [Fimbriimonadales bacterium]